MIPLFLTCISLKKPLNSIWIMKKTQILYSKPIFLGNCMLQKYTFILQKYTSMRQKGTFVRQKYTYAQVVPWMEMGPALRLISQRVNYVI